MPEQLTKTGVASPFRGTRPLPRIRLPSLRILRLPMPLLPSNLYPEFELPALLQFDLGCLCGPGELSNVLSRFDAPRLEHLLLAAPSGVRYNLSSQGVAAILARLRGTAVTSLGLSGWELPSRSIETLLTHPATQHLTRLHLGQVDRKGVTTLAERVALGQLHTLQLDGREDDVSVSLPALFQGELAQQLEILKLRRMGVSTPVLKRLHTSPLRERLRFLDLSGNAMGDEAGQALAEFASWPRLLCLDLHGTGLRAPVRRELREVLGERLHY